MSYLVTKYYSNGSTWGCGSKTWENSDWCDTMEEALWSLPPSDYKWYSHGVLESVEITDGSTGETIASVELKDHAGAWLRGDAILWEGYRPSEEGNVGFRVVTGPPHLVRATWEETLANIKQVEKEQRFKDAQKRLEQAKKQVQDIGF